MKEKIDIIIFGGQSNMQGQTEALSEAEAVNDAYEYKWLCDGLVPLKNPVGEDITYDCKEGYFFDKDKVASEWREKHVTGSSCYGYTNLVPQFCRSYLKHSDNKVIAVHIAKGSTVISQWLPETDGYDIIIKKALGAIEKAKEKYDINRIFFVWLQGESDALESTSKKDYKDRMEKLNNALKKDLGVEKFGVIRVGIFTKDSRDDEIMAAQTEVCRENADFLMLTDAAKSFFDIKEYMNPEAHGHFSAKGIEVLGNLSGDALGKYAYGNN